MSMESEGDSAIISGSFGGRGREECEVKQKKREKTSPNTFFRVLVDKSIKNVYKVGQRKLACMSKTNSQATVLGRGKNLWPEAQGPSRFPFCPSGGEVDREWEHSRLLLASGGRVRSPRLHCGAPRCSHVASPSLSRGVGAREGGVGPEPWGAQLCAPQTNQQRGAVLGCSSRPRLCTLLLP